MGVAKSCFWGSIVAILAACGGGAADGGETDDAGGNGGSSAGSGASDDGGAPASGAGGDSGASGGSSGASGGDPGASGGSSGANGEGSGAALRVDATYGAACGSEAARCSTRTYDENGNLIAAFEDGDCDGMPDTLCTMVVAWDGGSRHEQDTDCNGKPDTCSINVDLTKDDMRPAVGETCEGEAQC